MSSRRQREKKKKYLIAIVSLAALLAAGYYAYPKYFEPSSPEEIEEDSLEEMEVEVVPGQRLDGTVFIGDPKPEIPYPDTERETGDAQGHLEVHFIDVGQGDSILVNYIDDYLEDGDQSESMLIDAGDKNSGTTVRNYLNHNMPAGELTYFICTHPDEDHIGGAASIVSNVPIKAEKVYGSVYEKDTKVFQNLMNEIETKWYVYEKLDQPKQFLLGCAVVSILVPKEEHDANNSSLLVKVQYGNNSFLITGDCEEEEEADILDSYGDAELAADVIKIGHHGSKTGSSKEFIQAVAPKWAVISCGEGNSYHHPHAEVLNLLRTRGIALYRTDVQGSIIATTYGDGISWNTSSCNDWTAGE